MVETKIGVDGEVSNRLKICKNILLYSDDSNLREAAGTELITHYVTSGEYIALIGLPKHQKLPENVRNAAKNNIESAVMRAIEEYADVGEYKAIKEIADNFFSTEALQKEDEDFEMVQRVKITAANHLEPAMLKRLQIAIIHGEYGIVNELSDPDNRYLPETVKKLAKDNKSITVHNRLSRTDPNELKRIAYERTIDGIRIPGDMNIHVIDLAVCHMNERELFTIAEDNKKKYGESYNYEYETHMREAAGFALVERYSHPNIENFLQLVHMTGNKFLPEGVRKKAEAKAESMIQNITDNAIREGNYSLLIEIAEKDMIRKENGDVSYEFFELPKGNGLMDKLRKTAKDSIYFAAMNAIKLAETNPIQFTADPVKLTEISKDSRLDEDVRKSAYSKIESAVAYAIENLYDRHFYRTGSVEGIEHRLSTYRYYYTHSEGFPENAKNALKKAMAEVAAELAEKAGIRNPLAGDGVTSDATRFTVRPVIGSNSNSVAGTGKLIKKSS